MARGELAFGIFYTSPHKLSENPLKDNTSVPKSGVNVLFSRLGFPGVEMSL